MTCTSFIARFSRSIRWRLGLHVAAPELESGRDEDIAAFYRDRVTDCGFAANPDHYEQPRIRWILERVAGGRLLELGCGNGGMTRLLSSRVERLVALDVSTPSLAVIRSMGLGNVDLVESLIEHYRPDESFDWIVMSEVLEHLRSPEKVVQQCLGWLAPGGHIVVTTPHGHWESNEHLQEFTWENFACLFGGPGFESAYISYLRDGEERRRWLVADARAPAKAPAAEDFNRPAVIRRRRLS